MSVSLSDVFNLLVFFLGTVWGSFLSAFSYRFPRNIQSVHGRSFCDNCKKDLSWYENIPLVSYLFLGGKCKNCKKRISVRYPIIELACGIGFLLLWPNPLYLSIFSVLLLIFVIDFEHQIIPDSLVWIGILLTLFIPSPTPLLLRLLAGFFFSTILLLLHLVTLGKGMGLGDVKFAILGGLFFGPLMGTIWLLLSFLTGGIAGVILILTKKAGLKDKIAFGPFLIISVLLTILYGEKIIKWINLN